MRHNGTVCDAEHIYPSISQTLTHTLDYSKLFSNAREQFKARYKSTPDALLVLNEELHISHMDSHSIGLFNEKAIEYLGGPYQALFHQSDHPAIQTLLRETPPYLQSAKSPQGKKYDLAAITVDGSLVLALFQRTERATPEGKVKPTTTHIPAESWLELSALLNQSSNLPHLISLLQSKLPLLLPNRQVQIFIPCNGILSTIAVLPDPKSPLAHHCFDSKSCTAALLGHPVCISPYGSSDPYLLNADNPVTIYPIHAQSTLQGIIVSDATEQELTPLARTLGPALAERS